MKTNNVNSDIIITDDHQVIDDDENDISFENRCGLFKWRPNFLQRFRSIYLFLVTACIVCIIQTALSAGYMSSQITTLERRFSLDSSMLGIIQSFFDVGFILSVIFVGYFGGQGRIPSWIGVGMLIMCLGAFSFSLPQFISTHSYKPSTGIIDSTICKTYHSNSTVFNCTSENKANWVVKLVFIVGQVLIGCGSSPILSLAPTYIDDHVTPTLAPPLIALLYASSALGPVIGFGLGAIMLQYPDNGKALKGSKPGDHDWIGVWWGGYVCLGICAAFVAIFLFMFPRRVRKITTTRLRSLGKKNKKNKNQTDILEMKDGTSPSIEPLMEGKLSVANVIENVPNEPSQGTSVASVQISNEIDASKYGKSIKDIPRAILALLTNKIYVVVSLAICCEMFLVNGFAAFLPKYIENEYKVSNITSSLIAGGLIVPAGALGIVAGGLIMHRFQIGRRRAVLLSIIGVFLVLVCLTLFFLSGCNNPLFAGINTPVHYNNGSFKNISNACNSEKCFNECDPNQFSPVCDVKSGVTFFSGCYAGCENFVLDSVDKKFFYNCTCTALRQNSSGNPVLVAGECPLKCNSLITFVLFLTLALFLTGITQNPLLMVTIRSVQKHERSFALGFQFVILRVLAYIPSPIIYGSVIDAACVHWKKTCNERGDCLVTDLKLLNYYIIGLSFAVKCGAAVFYILLYFIIPKHVHNDTEQVTNNQTGHNTVVLLRGSNGDVSSSPVPVVPNHSGPSLS